MSGGVQAQDPVPRPHLGSGSPLSTLDPGPYRLPCEGFQSKIPERTFRTVLGSEPEEGGGTRGPLLPSFLPPAFPVVMKCGMRKLGASEIGVAPWGSHLLSVSCS